MQEEEARYQRAKQRVEQLKAFYQHLIVFICVNLLLVTINWITFSGSWWFFYPLAGWGAGLFVHFLTTISNGLFGEKWEEKKINEYMEKERYRDK